ncbi:MAG: 2-isopropylmalate synthase [Dehalococcoidia bacterium]
MTDRVIIFDTTLRDGEQTAGVALNGDDKMEIAEQLAKTGVDVIEAGFAASSPGDFEAVRKIAHTIRGPKIATLARAVPGDVEAAIDAVSTAPNPRIHVFISSSDIHIMHQMQKDREAVMTQAIAMVSRAREAVEDVEFSPMDATRTEPRYLWQLLEAVIDAGATTINVPDTVGYTVPNEFEEMLKDIYANVRNIHKAVLSVHCHNDLGLATANSITALGVGARQIEVCVNGLGERAGNASLEEVVMAIKTRGDIVGVETGVNTRELYRTSRLVSDLTGIVVQPNKAVVGLNAFRHASGIHQDAVIKLRENFEIMDPREIGHPEATKIVLTKVSGRAGLKKRLEELGYELTQDELDRVFMKFKDLADKKQEVDDRDLEALLADQARETEEVWHLERVHVIAGDTVRPTATVRLIDKEGTRHEDAAVGDGPVDAVYQAINRIVGVPNTLIEYTVKSITEGIDAQGDVIIRIESGGRTFTGRGADTDIIVASAKAYMNALNKLLTVRSVSQPLASTP